MGMPGGGPEAVRRHKGFPCLRVEDIAARMIEKAGEKVSMAWDEEKLPALVVKYPYFLRTADKDDWIGGYACEPKRAVNFGWMCTSGEIINSLSMAGLHFEWFPEFDWLYYKLSGDKQERDGNGNRCFPEQRGKLLFTFSLKAVV
jgi:hypothetical protein